MEFPYVRGEGTFGPVYRPNLPVTLSYGTKNFRLGHALVDTGADMTVLPLDIAHYLEIELDDSRTVRIEGAGGGVFVAMPSSRKIGYAIEQKGHRPVCWQGVAYLAGEQPLALLGHFDCLEKLDLQFFGAQRLLRVLRAQR